MRFTSVKKMEKKKLKNLSPEMANILSNFEGWGPTEVAYKKKVYFLIISACELRVFYRHPLRNPYILILQLDPLLDGHHLSLFVSVAFFSG